MSDIHVLTGDDRGSWRVAFHFPVPNAANEVGVNYRTAILNSGLGGTTVMPEGDEAGQISAAEKGDIEAGSVYERVVDFRVEGNGESSGAVQASLEADYARELTLAIESLQGKLKYFGHTLES